MIYLPVGPPPCLLCSTWSPRSLGSSFSQVFFLPSLPPPEYQLLLNMSLLLLDPFPFGGGVTSLEAFAYCKPVVTLPSLQTVPRLTGGMLQSIGARDLIATSEQTMVDLVAKVVRNSTWRAVLESAICAAVEKGGGLYESPQAVEEWATWLARVHLTVSSTT